MSRLCPKIFAAGVFFLLGITFCSSLAAEPDQAGLDLFENRIRPVLVQHCYQCHGGGKKLKGGLRLDTRAGWEQGGDSGPPVVPGKPEESLLIGALRYNGDIKMPPKGKLPQSVIDDFERWVKLKATVPRDADQVKPARSAGIDVVAGRRHWSYRLPVNCPSPVVRDAAWPRTPIDGFILSRLEADDLQPVADAGRATLVRRLYFDLLGLPPTPEQIDEFLADQSPAAWERLVDRLLASPRFGERWGRHWLDVVRFAESLTLRGFVLKEAWRYRDYVIDAFDGDLPYDAFLREQIAGDLISSRATLKERQRRLVATTVLTLGNTNLEEQDKAQLEMDVVDEQLDLIGRGFLAQTITCARCHDHKFDPIPTRDYYALAGILKNAKSLEHFNVSKWIEVPLPQAPDQEALFERYEKKLAALRTELAETRQALTRTAGRADTRLQPSIVAPNDLRGIVVDDATAKRVGDWRQSRSVQRYIGDGYLHDFDSGKGEKTLTFVPELPATGTYEVLLAYTSGSNRAADVPVIVFSGDGEKTVVVNQREAPPIDGRFVSLGRYRFERGGQSFVIVSNAGTKGHVVADAVQFLSETDATAASGLASAPAKVEGTTPESSDAKQFRDKIKRLDEELKVLIARGPSRPMVMTVVEKSNPADLRVHVRGNVHDLGSLVARGFLQVASSTSPPAIPADSGGRRQLADWLASRDNPLTARVMVNRVWHWLFGAGLVRTTDNFGATGETPSHPQLLDHLAVTFVEDGWSIKRLIRRIVLSRTYQLSVSDDGQAQVVDPENRLLWRRNRRRLDAECLRDAMLQVSGALRSDRGGPSCPADLPADYGYIDTSFRRSLYLPVFRNALPAIFEVFDFADPSLVTGRRNTSTVAPQALFLMNHPFVLEQSHLASERLLAEDDADDGAKLTRAYRLILGRAPNAEERNIAVHFLASTSASDDTSRMSTWSQLIQALFATVQFRYVD